MRDADEWRAHEIELQRRLEAEAARCPHRPSEPVTCTRCATAVICHVCDIHGRPFCAPSCRDAQLRREIR